MAIKFDKILGKIRELDQSAGTGGGAGDVVGPSSAINDELASYNGTTGKLIKGTGYTTTTIRSRTNHTGTQAESTISFTDITTGNASTTSHGYLPKLSGSSGQFLNGSGIFSVPTLTTSWYSSTAFNGQTTVTVNHGFGQYPIVQVLGSSGEVIVPLTITNTNTNQVVVTFISATTGTIILTLGVPQPARVTTTATNYTVLGSDNIIKVTASGVTVTLPTTIGASGVKYNIDNASAGNITVTGTGGQTLQGSASQTIASNSKASFYSDGANWRFI